MKIAFRIAAIAAGAALALTACAGPPLVAGSEVGVAVAEPFTSLNPATSFGRSSVTNGDVAHLTGTGFGYLDDVGAFVADESFGTVEVVAEDPLTVRYAVTAAARWSDGTPVDAADLLLAWVANSGALNTPDFDDREWVDAETGRYRDDFPTDVVFFDGAVGGGLERATQTPQLGEDGRTVFVHFDEVVSGWRLALAPGVPAHVVADRALGPFDDADAAKQALISAVVDADLDALGAIARVWNDAYNVTSTPDDLDLLVASGPYVVAAITTDEVVLAANTAYRGDRLPSFETIRIRIAPDPLDAAALLADGTVDIAVPEPSVEVVAALTAIDGVDVVTGTDARVEHLDLQFADARGSAFTDERVRRAFLLVVPRQEILEELVTPVHPDAALLDSFVLLPGAAGYAESVAENGSAAYAEPDVAAAIDLLAEAGQPNPEVCILFDPANPRRQAEVDLIRTSADRAGFRVTDCSNPDWERLLGVSGAYDAALFAWDTTRLGAAAAAAVYRSDSALVNFSRYANPEVDALVDEVAATEDPALQAAALARIDALLWADAYGVPLFAYPTVTAVRSTVDGVTRSPLDRTVFWNAWEWRPAPASDAAVR
jgi:peptide/nickel transport system substrate-binding protein